MVRSVSVDEVARLLRGYSGPNPASIEDLLVYLRRRLPALTYHQLRRRLETLAEKGLVKPVKVRLVYVYDGRKLVVTKTLWEVKRW